MLQYLLDDDLLFNKLMIFIPVVMVNSILWQDELTGKVSRKLRDKFRYFA